MIIGHFVHACSDYGIHEEQFTHTQQKAGMGFVTQVMPVYGMTWKEITKLQISKESMS